MSPPHLKSPMVHAFPKPVAWGGSWVIYFETKDLH